MSPEEKILEYEKLSRLLESGSDRRKTHRREVLDYSEKFLNQVEKLPAFIIQDEASGNSDLLSIGSYPGKTEDIISHLNEQVDKYGLNPASGGHLGYIPGGGVYQAALGDYLAAVFNRYAGVFYAGPNAVRLENYLLRWTAGLMGYPENAAGNITSGGSIANLMAVVTARDAKKIEPEKIKDAVIYCTAQAHHSLFKAIRIAGLSHCPIRYVPMDSHFRMDAKELARLIREDRQSGKNPFLVIGSAGTTDTGSIDPLDQIADVCAAEKCWFHVDAAYGGYFVMTREGKEKLKGMERSDSLVTDPHKGLFLPYGAGIVLVKDKKHLSASHFYQAQYLQDADAEENEPSPADLSAELTKHFRGLRMWIPLKIHGTEPFIACLNEKLLLTRYFREEVSKLGFETGPEPDLSVTIYRFVPRSGDADAFNLALQQKVVKEGSVFISSTRINGRVWLRFACLSFRTRLSTVKKLLEVLKRETAL
jgi:aromatic-L-amino-acid/L-tryptophan decarboxylase